MFYLPSSLSDVQGGSVTTVGLSSLLQGKKYKQTKAYWQTSESKDT